MRLGHNRKVYSFSTYRREFRRFASARMAGSSSRQSTEASMETTSATLFRR
jgi:hypothetical protein